MNLTYYVWRSRACNLPINCQQIDRNDAITERAESAANFSNSFRGREVDSQEVAKYLRQCSNEYWRNETKRRTA